MSRVRICVALNENDKRKFNITEQQRYEDFRSQVYDRFEINTASTLELSYKDNDNDNRYLIKSQGDFDVFFEAAAEVGSTKQINVHFLDTSVPVSTPPSSLTSTSDAISTTPSTKRKLSSSATSTSEQNNKKKKFSSTKVFTIKIPLELVQNESKTTIKFFSEDGKHYYHVQNCLCRLWANASNLGRDANNCCKGEISKLKQINRAFYLESETLLKLLTTKGDEKKNIKYYNWLNNLLSSQSSPNPHQQQELKDDNASSISPQQQEFKSDASTPHQQQQQQELKYDITSTPHQQQEDLNSDIISTPHQQQQQQELKHDITLTPHQQQQQQEFKSDTSTPHQQQQQELKYDTKEVAIDKLCLSVDRKVPLPLPVPIELSTMHPQFGHIQVIAILWYVDKFSTNLTQPTQSAQYFEYFKYRTDREGTERTDCLPVRICFFHSIQSVSPPHCPFQTLVGRFFSSLNFTANLFGSSSTGWNAWSILGTSKLKDVLTISKWTEGRAAKHFFNNPILTKPQKFPQTTFPEIITRDLFAALCIEECDQHRCLTPDGISCRHNIRHQFEQTEINPEDVKWDENACKRKRDMLTLEFLISPWGKKITFYQLMATDLIEKMHFEFWYDKLFKQCKQLIALKWPDAKIDLFTHIHPFQNTSYIQSIQDLTNIQAFCNFRQLPGIVGSSKFNCDDGNNVVVSDGDDVDDVVNRSWFLVRWIIRQRDNWLLAHHDRKALYNAFLYTPIRGKLLLDSGMVTDKSFLSNFLQPVDPKLLQDWEENEAEAKKIAVMNVDVPDGNGDVSVKKGLEAPQYYDFFQNLNKLRAQVWSRMNRAEDIIDDTEYSPEQQNLFKEYEKALYNDLRNGPP